MTPQTNWWPLTESERGLIEGGTATFGEIMEGRRLLTEAKEKEIAEAAEVAEWDRAHCGVCGAVLADEPDHCR